MTNTTIKPHHFNRQVVRMRIREITELVDNTSDSAFAVDGSGQIVAWNYAEVTFGRPGGRFLEIPKR